MKISIKALQPDKIKMESTVICVFDKFEHFSKNEIPAGFEAQIEILMNSKASDFKGKLSEILVLYSNLGLQTKSPSRLILAGMGSAKDYSIEKLREAFGNIGNLCCEKKFNELGLILPSKKGSRLSRKEDALQSATAVIEGLLLGSYRFNKYKSGEDVTEFDFEDITVFSRSAADIPSLRKGVEYAKVSTEIAKIARDLTNTPSNDLTPTELTKRSKTIAKKYGLQARIISGNMLQQQKLNGILAVGKGSVNPPHLIILEYIPASLKGKSGKTKPIVFIGKAVTFDSGGISLKPGANMDLMKMDMAGGAAVISSIAGLAMLKAPIHAVGLIPAVENLPSGSAQRPGDIIEYKNGKFIEVLNTDVATLTGACVVALGSHAAGLMGNSEKLMDTIEKVSKQTGEPVWKLPLWKPYSSEMKSEIADVKNVSGREGGAITAAAFLLEFAEKYEWAHIDIAGMAWVNKTSSFTPRGATGFSSRLLLALGKTIADKKLF
jgi:leucyl aminopeptidase